MILSECMQDELLCLVHLKVGRVLRLHSTRFFFSIYNRQLLCAGFASFKFEYSTLALVIQELNVCCLPDALQ